MNSEESSSYGVATEYIENYPMVSTSEAIREVQIHGFDAKVVGNRLLLIEHGFDETSLPIVNGEVRTASVFNWLGY